MADLALTEAQIAVVHPATAKVFAYIAAETLTAGQICFVDTDGKLEAADANASGEQQARVMALNGGGAGQAIDGLKEGHVYGFTITQAYDAPIFLSDTVGLLADAAGTLEVPLGIVVPLTDGSTLTKVLYFSARWRADYA